MTSYILIVAFIVKSSECVSDEDICLTGIEEQVNWLLTGWQVNCQKWEHYLRQ